MNLKNKRKRFPAITRAALKKLAGDVYFERGVDYYDAGTVVQLRVGNDGITARVQGSELIPYLVRFWHEKQKLQWGCACPLGDEGAFCKHVVATGLAYRAGDEVDNLDSEPDNADALEEIRQLLKLLDPPALEDLITQQALWDERLLAELRLLGRAARDIYNKNK